MKRCSHWSCTGKTIIRCEREAVTERTNIIKAHGRNRESFKTMNGIDVTFSIGTDTTKVTLQLCQEHAEVHDARQREMNK